jgi:hypothetical protein
MALDYFILVFMSSLGVYQITAIHAKLDGLCFFRHPVVQYIFGILAIIGAFGWFFTSTDRNIHTTVEGAQQLGLFLGSIVASYVFTAILASVMQAKVSAKEGSPRESRQYKMGIETLKKTTLFGGIMSSLRRERKDKV